MALQLASMGLLGMSGYAIFKRSQKLQLTNNNKPVHIDQELNARNYIIPIVKENINSIGTDLSAGILATGWGKASSKDINNDTVIEFPSGYPAITYSQLVGMNGLKLMQLCNNARLKHDTSPPIFDLETKKLQKPLSTDIINAIKAVKNKL